MKSKIKVLNRSTCEEKKDCAYWKGKYICTGTCDTGFVTIIEYYCIWKETVSGKCFWK